LALPGVFTVRFVDEAEGTELNGQYREKPYATNVLTFPYACDETCEADLVICPTIVAREAAEQKKPLMAHYAHLIVHGTLHAQGYDHETDEKAEEMEVEERAILAELGFEDPYREAG
jgi:probable rRNA maturation factor